ncbi:MAG: cytochrome c [Actinomycetota bacterium]
MPSTSSLRLFLPLAVLALAGCGGGSGSGASEPLTGAEVYARACATCHADDGGGFVGPPLVGIHDRLPEAEIMAVIANGRVGEIGAMAGIANQYSSDEIAAVTEYLRTLG